MMQGCISPLSVPTSTSIHHLCLSAMTLSVDKRCTTLVSGVLGLPASGRQALTGNADREAQRTGPAVSSGEKVRGSIPRSQGRGHLPWRRGLHFTLDTKTGKRAQINCSPRRRKQRPAVCDTRGALGCLTDNTHDTRPRPGSWSVSVAFSERGDSIPSH